MSEGAQPDWYLGFLDGSVRLWPHWEFRSFGHEIANPFFPGLLIPGLVFTIMYAWPWIDKKIYNDYGPHNLLDRPRDKPFRPASGVAAIIFFLVLTIACADDILANDLHVPFERLIEILQYTRPDRAGGRLRDRLQGLSGPAGTNAHPIQRPIGGIIVRTSDGAYHTLAEITATATARRRPRGRTDMGDDRAGAGVAYGHAGLSPRGCASAGVGAKATTGRRRRRPRRRRWRSTARPMTPTVLGDRTLRRAAGSPGRNAGGAMEPLVCATSLGFFAAFLLFRVC